MNHFTTILILILCVGFIAVGVIWFLRPSQAPLGGGAVPNNLPANDVPTAGQGDEASQTAVQAAFKEGIAPYLNDNIRLNQTVIEGGYALQVWSGDYAAGEGLLTYDVSQNKWILVSGGGGIWTLQALIDEGVPTSTAQILIQKVNR